MGDYDGNGELLETYGSVGVCPNHVTGQISKRPQTRRAHARHDTGYWMKDILTWNTALAGVPTLAEVNQTWSCANYNTGHTDYVEGPTGLPMEQLAYDSGTSTWTPDWFYQDFQGRTREMLGKTASIDQSYSDEPWGAQEGSSPQAPVDYGSSYTDNLWSGMVFDQARWLDPASGQFVSQDPETSQTLQPFSYASDDPAALGDPSGLSSSSENQYSKPPSGWKQQLPSKQSMQSCLPAETNPAKLVAQICYRANEWQTARHCLDQPLRRGASAFSSAGRRSVPRRTAVASAGPALSVLV